MTEPRRHIVAPRRRRRIGVALVALLLTSVSAQAQVVISQV